jgi:hypothetical protein
MVRSKLYMYCLNGCVSYKFIIRSDVHLLNPSSNNEIQRVLWLVSSIPELWKKGVLRTILLVIGWFEQIGRAQKFASSSYTSVASDYRPYNTNLPLRFSDSSVFYRRPFQKSILKNFYLKLTSRVKFLTQAYRAQSPLSYYIQLRLD